MTPDSKEERMQTKAYFLISATLFGFVAIAHAVRLILALPVMLGTEPLPMWVSWAGVVATGALSVWGFTAAVSSSCHVR
jgi:hypothetical protein